MSTGRPKIADLRSFYGQAVTWNPALRLAAVRQIVTWYETQAAFKPVQIDNANRFKKLRELVLNNPGVQEALTAAERVLPVYEQQLLDGVNKAPSWKNVQAEISARESELKAQYEQQQQQEAAALKATQHVAATLNEAFSTTGITFSVRAQDKQRSFDGKRIVLSVAYATTLQALGRAGMVVRVLDFVVKVLAFDPATNTVNGPEYLKQMPVVLEAVSIALSRTSQADGAFQLLKRAHSDKQRLVGERYRPNTYQALVWERLYKAKGEWIGKKELTAGFDIPWPHRVPIHLQKDGARGGRWVVDIERDRVRMRDVTVQANLPE